MTRLKTRRKQAMVGRRDDERRGLIWFAQTQVKANIRRKQAMMGRHIDERRGWRNRRLNPVWQAGQIDVGSNIYNNKYI